MSAHRTRSHSSTGRRKAGPWGQERRLEFIDFRLQWEGRLNRSDLMAHFGISVPQASADIAKYAELAPRNLTYDRSKRVYVSTAHFRPAIQKASPERYLDDLLAVSTGVLHPSGTYLGWLPPAGIAASPTRGVAAKVLAVVLDCIQRGLRLKVLYQSMSRPEPAWRDLSPHALGHDGFRWHVRAYCHERDDFRDFVLARCLEVKLGDPAPIEPAADVQWVTDVRLVLIPNPGLSASKKRAIELDYGMQDGEVEVHCKQAMLYYVLQRLGLNADGHVRPEAQQIKLKNADEVAKYLAPTTRS